MTVAELIARLRDIPDQDMDVVLHIDDSGTSGYTSHISMEPTSIGWHANTSEPEHEFQEFCKGSDMLRTALVMAWG